MAHLDSIGAVMFTDLSVSMPTTDLTQSAADALNSASTFAAVFGAMIDSNPPGLKTASSFVRIKNVREFPEMGVPPNIVNVPVYGQKTSVQIQGQADAPQLTVTMNYVASEWDSTSHLGAAVGNDKQYAFRLAMLNSKPTNYLSTASTGMGQSGVKNTVFYFIGKIEAMVVSPQLADAVTAQLTLSVTSPIYGAYTIT
jgi:hypothetical protein